MITLRPGFLYLTREDGRFILVRVDEIMHVLENTFKKDGVATACLTLQLRNNLSVHVEKTLEEFRSMYGQAADSPMHIIGLP